MSRRITAISRSWNAELQGWFVVFEMDTMPGETFCCFMKKAEKNDLAALERHLNEHYEEIYQAVSMPSRSELCGNCKHSVG